MEKWKHFEHTDQVISVVDVCSHFILTSLVFSDQFTQTLTFCTMFSLNSAPLGESPAWLDGTHFYTMKGSSIFLLGTGNTFKIPSFQALFVWPYLSRLNWYSVVLHP